VQLVFAGTPQAALPSLAAVLESSHDLMAVVSRPDAPAGRGRRLAESPVARRAAAAGVEVLKPASPKEPEFLSRLAELAPDCCPVVAYGALLPGSVLGVPAHGWVNLHFSLLPAWRGAAPVQHALLTGDEITGASTFRIVAELDAGPVFGLLTEPILADDTAGSLLDRLGVRGAGLLVRTLDGIEDGTLVPVGQPADGVSYAPKLTVEEAHVDWRQPALAVDRRIRACTPDPGAWTTVDGVRLKLGPVAMRPEMVDLPRGTLEVMKSEVLVGTGTHAVALGDVQPPGKRPMPAADWARGARIQRGSALGLPAP